MSRGRTDLFFRTSECRMSFVMQFTFVLQFQSKLRVSETQTRNGQSRQIHRILAAWIQKKNRRRRTVEVGNEVRSKNVTVVSLESFELTQTDLSYSNLKNG